MTRTRKRGEAPACQSDHLRRDCASVWVRGTGPPVCVSRAAAATELQIAGCTARRTPKNWRMAVYGCRGNSGKRFRWRCDSNSCKCLLVRARAVRRRQEPAAMAGG